MPPLLGTCCQSFCNIEQSALVEVSFAITPSNESVSHRAQEAETTRNIRLGTGDMLLAGWQSPRRVVRGSAVIFTFFVGKY